VVQRTDGTCLYHLANVVDDYDLQITHVIRAEEHLSNTPRQVFILEALGYPRPIYAICRSWPSRQQEQAEQAKARQVSENRDFAQLVEHGRKIAAAIGHAVDADAFNPVIVDFYRTVGYLPEAIVNYMALLGWSLDDKTEHFSRQELIEKFSLERVVKSPASFDPKKLQAFEDWHFQQLRWSGKSHWQRHSSKKPGWSNRRRQPSSGRRSRRSSPPPATASKWPAIFSRLTISSAPTINWPMTSHPFDKHIRKADAVPLLTKFRDRLAAVEPFDVPTAEAMMHQFVATEGIKIQPHHPRRPRRRNGQVSRPRSFDTLAILGRDRVLRRMDRAIKTV